MKASKQVLGILALVSSLGVAMSTHAAPPDRVQISRTHSFDLSASVCVDYICEFIVVNQTEDSSGTLIGWIQVQLLDYNVGFVSTITCQGPEYAHIVSLNETNGNSSLNVILDPAQPTCSSTNVASPLTLSLVGRADGNYKSVQRGTSLLEAFGTRTRMNYVQTLYGQVFNGNGAFLAGPLTGQAGSIKVTDRQRVN